MSKCKILLNEKPILPEDDCPFYRTICQGDCRCRGGYYDSMTFEFEKCPYCTTMAGITLNASTEINFA